MPLNQQKIIKIILEERANPLRKDATDTRKNLTEVIAEILTV